MPAPQVQVPRTMQNLSGGVPLVRKRQGSPERRRGGRAKLRGVTHSFQLHSPPPGQGLDKGTHLSPPPQAVGLQGCGCGPRGAESASGNAGGAAPARALGGTGARYSTRAWHCRCRMTGCAGEGGNALYSSLVVSWELYRKIGTRCSPRGIGGRSRGERVSRCAARPRGEAHHRQR